MSINSKASFNIKTIRPHHGLSVLLGTNRGTAEGRARDAHYYPFQPPVTDRTFRHSISILFCHPDVFAPDANAISLARPSATHSGLWYNERFFFQYIPS